MTKLPVLRTRGERRAASVARPSASCGTGSSRLTAASACFAGRGMRASRALRGEVGPVPLALFAGGVERGDRVGIWSPNNAEWVVLVRDRQDRRDPRQHQPGLPAHRARVRAAPVGLHGAGPGAGLQGRRLRRDPRRDRTLRGSGAGSCSDRVGRVAGASPTRFRPPPARTRPGSSISTTRSTSSTRRARPASPRARRCRTTTS